MRIVVSYDIDTATPDGQRRLRHVAKACERRGTRVQDSVFEMELDPAALQEFQDRLASLIDPARDSVRFYRLGRHWETRVQVIGNAEKPERLPLIWI